MYQFILTEINNRVAVIRFNRPEQGNAFAKESYDEIRRAVEECDLDNRVGAIVITGTGRHFSAGGDIRRFKGLIENGEYISTGNIQRAGEMAKAMRTCKKPVIAMVNGAAAGAGCSLALACDFRFVTPKSKFIMSFIKLGLSGDTGGMYYLQRLVGTARTLELMMLGDMVGGEEAVRLGLATRCVGEDTLEKETLDFAAGLAHGPLFGYAKQKELMMKHFYAGLEDYYKDEALFMAECSRTDDFSEAVDAFLEKRPPVFKSR